VSRGKDNGKRGARGAAKMLTQDDSSPVIVSPSVWLVADLSVWPLSDEERV
jgi:hypothetical protein